MLTLVEKLGVNDIKHFETRSEPVLRKMLLLIATTETQEALIEKFVNKYATSICESITARFPKDSCEVLEAFSIFDVDLLPASSSSPLFSIHRENEDYILAKKIFPQKPSENIQSEWKDFKYELLEIKKKYILLKKQLNANKLKFKKTSSEWTLEHILNAYQGEVEFPCKDSSHCSRDQRVAGKRCQCS